MTLNEAEKEILDLKATITELRWAVAESQEKLRRCRGANRRLKVDIAEEMARTSD